MGNNTEAIVNMFRSVGQLLGDLWRYIHYTVRSFADTFHILQCLIVQSITITTEFVIWEKEIRHTYEHPSLKLVEVIKKKCGKMRWLVTV
jgi:hypothetical protein